MYEDPPKPPIIEKKNQRTSTSFKSKKNINEQNCKTESDRMMYLSRSIGKPVFYDNKKISDMAKEIILDRPGSPNLCVSEGNGSLKTKSVGFEADEDERIEYENNVESSKRR